MKLSIILPCYNVSKYISKCLDSILAINLNAEDYEVLCVDDCSTDNTPKIIQSYQQRYANLRLIQHEENKASGGARNTGLRAAKGDYVWFIDPDDMIYSEYVDAMVDSCISNNLDVLCFNYEDIDEQNNVLSRPPIFKKTDVLNGVNFINTIFGDEIVYHIGYVTRFLYRRQYLLNKEIFFPERTFWQDTIYMPQAIFLADKVQGLSTFVYRYRHHNASVCGSFVLGYSGIKIYQWVFNAGFYVLNFSQDIRNLDAHYSDLFYRFAHIHYFNQLPIFLFRTSAKERTRFYQQVSFHSDRVAEVYPYLNKISKLLLRPIIGPVSASILSFVYKLTHRQHQK